MPVGGDPNAIRALARRLRTVATEVDDTGARVLRSQGVEWVGLAADRYRERLADRAREIAGTSESVDDAAARLEELATALEERQAMIAAAMAEVEDRLDGARSFLGRIGGIASDALTSAERTAANQARRLLDTVPEVPPPGHPLWLELSTRLRSQ